MCVYIHAQGKYNFLSGLLGFDYKLVILIRSRLGHGHGQYMFNCMDTLVSFFSFFFNIIYGDKFFTILYKQVLYMNQTN